MSTPPGAQLVSATAIACERGGRRVFSDLSFAVRGSTCVELRGPNGAGKSSLLRLLAGFDQPAEGTLALAAPASYVGHADAFKPALTVAENLSFWRDCLGGGDVAVALAAFDLGFLRDEPAALLSQGQRRRLALARLALHDRPIWLLDEPTVGLDSASLEKLRTLIKSHLSAGGCVIAATHQDLGLAPVAVLSIGPRP